MFTVYGSYFFGNKGWEEGQTQIAVGDEVIVCGKVIDYNGNTPEFASKKSWLVSVNGKTSEGGDAPAGSAAKPFTIAEAIAFIDGGGTGDVYVAGVVSKIVDKGEFTANYGNGSFWISDDGKFYDDPTKDFEAYRVYWLDNKKWVEGDKQIAVGDKVVLCGQLTKYKTTYETNQNKAYVFSVK